MTLPPPTPKQTRILWLALTSLAVAVLAALLVGLIWGLGQVLRILSPVLWPIAVAGVMAYLLDPVVDFLEQKCVPRPRAILCVFAAALVAVLGLAASVIPHLVTETSDLVSRIPDYTARVQNRAVEWISHPPAPLRRFLESRPVPSGATNGAAATNLAELTNPAPPPASTNAPPDAKEILASVFGQDTVKSATSWLALRLPKAGSWLLGQAGKVASWFGVLAGLALIPVYAFYFLLEKQGIESKWTNYLPVTNSSFKDELVFVLRSINGYLIVFFRGQVLVAMCDGALYAIGFLLIGLPYAVLLGVMATVLTMIPFLGAIATCVAALLLALVQYGDWKHPLLVLGVFGVVQTLEGLIISPKILGDRVGLHPLTIIIAVMVGTTLLGGILGGILAIPLTAALRVVMFRYVWKADAATRASV